MMSSPHYTNNNNGPDQILPAESFKTSEPDGCVKLYMTETGPSSEKPVSVYSAFETSARTYLDHPALCIKRNGNWKKWTYMEYFMDCCTVAKAFIKLGLEKFHGVCIMGNNSPEWVISSYGAIFAGGLSAGVYTTNSPEACNAIADNCKAQIIIVEDEVCLSKFLAIKRFLPSLKALIQWSGVPGAPGVITWPELMAIGAHESDVALQERLSQAAVNQCCSLIYTSGTTGFPKGVMLSQDQTTWGSIQAQSIGQMIPMSVVKLSYLPLSHVAGQLGDMYNAIVSGTTVYFAPPDALKTGLGQTLLEVRPTIFFGVPRVWEKIYETLHEVVSNAGFFKGSVVSWARAQALQYYNALRDGKELSSLEMFKYNLAKKLVFNKVKEAVGLDRATLLYSAAAPISSDVLDFLYSLDMPIMEAYGMTESMAAGSFSLPQQKYFKIGSVGKITPLSEMTLKGTDEYENGVGEICIRGRNVCMGYLGMPKETDEAIDDDGWLHTGDLGRFDSEGFLYITGRLKELLITSGGENIPPILIEEAVKRELPCVSNAMLVGDKRKYLTILLTFKSEIDLDTGSPLEKLTAPCQNWLRMKGCHLRTVGEAINELEQNPNGNLAKAIQNGIDRYNAHHAISNAQKLQHWTFLPHDFSLPTGELNNTLKLKRFFVLEKYADLIDRMYRQSDQLVSKL